MDQNLPSIYRVSFDIEIKSQDELSLSDFAQALTDNLGEDLVAKVSHLDISKIAKHGEVLPQMLKVGDMVQLKDSIKIQADVYNDDGYLFVGSKNDVSEVIACDAEMTIEAGLVGYINKIANGKIEVVNLDKPYVNKSWAELGIDAVNLDLITINADQVEKLVGEDH